MTQIRTDAPVRRETLATYRGRAIMVELHAGYANFAHDVCGIRRHLDRETGQLTDCFVPRFAAQ